MFYAKISPQYKQKDRYINIINEIIVMCMLYNLMFLTDLSFNAFLTPVRVADA